MGKISSWLLSENLYPKPSNVSDHLIIFIKNPLPGRAKTRLAKTVGNEEALRIYKRLLRHTRQVSEGINVTRHLFYSDFIDDSDEWAENHFHKYIQTGDSLGERMSNAFRQIDGMFPLSRKIIIGSDCPGLTPDILSGAFDGLNTCDFVLGPSEDGGYYLLGMKSILSDVFEDIPWSTEQVATITSRRIAASHSSLEQMPVLSDVDTEEDWKKLAYLLDDRKF